jgi:ATP-dependent DNA helicase RecG
LLTSSEDAEARERLRVVASEHDGFRIAEEDLRRRGVGDLQGTRQTGMPELRFADLATYAGLVELGRREAEAILAVDPELVHLEHRGLAQAVAERLRCARPIAEEAG